MHVLYIYVPRVYVAFILDMKIIFNKIINNNRPPAWYFSLTRTGNKEFTIVGLISVLAHMRILAHTRMGRPICVYSYGTSHIATYTHNGMPICVWDNILSHMSILFACFISLQVFGYCWYK